MSIFSKIKGAKKAAEKHKQAKASEIPVEKKDAPVPYRHIPTHAAADALTGTPSSWREEDRAAIQHHHKRRSMMTRNSSMISGTLHPSSSYTGSEFSNGVGPAASSSRPSPTRLETRKSYQGTGHYQPSPLGSNGVSPTGSEHSNSSSSSHLVELPRVQHLPPSSRASVHGHHLSPMGNTPRTTTRKLGEAPQLSTPPSRVLPVTAPVVAPTPVNPKKRSWGFMKRNGQGPAIAVH
ncbi:MAG: hypothetical protein L6R35_004264 [Caloplaca aegaea]|nr:MAG: hypothetical protein L6R35_004264 [Caloplaca aegaea]